MLFVSKNLTDKIGFNCFHDLGEAWNQQNLERALNLTVQSGAKYLRPAFSLQQDEYDGGNNDWRIEPFKKIVSKGITIVLCFYPQQLKGHLEDSDIDEMIDKAVSAYTNIVDRLLSAGIQPNQLIGEAWNEADGGFAMTPQNDGPAQTNSDVIDKYLTFNMKMNDVCHQRGIRFMDLCSIEYPHSPYLSLVMKDYNQKMASYSSKPEYISYHPYCDRNRGDNIIPEEMIGSFNLSDWSNLSDIPLAVSEFGFPSMDWGDPFSGKFPFQYSRDMMIRQIIIQDYLGVDPIIIYSANTNPDPSDAGSDDCWGAYQYHKSDGSITLSDLGAAELKFLQTMQGYWLSNAVLVPSDHSQESLTYSNYAFEYTNSNGNKKLFYWNPMGYNTSSLNWNNQTYNLTFTQHVKEIDV